MKNKDKKENQTELMIGKSGYVSNLLLLIGGVILLSFFCVYGAVYLVK